MAMCESEMQNAVQEMIGEWYGQDAKDRTRTMGELSARIVSLIAGTDRPAVCRCAGHDGDTVDGPEAAHGASELEAAA